MDFLPKIEKTEENPPQNEKLFEKDENSLWQEGFIHKI